MSFRAAIEGERELAVPRPIRSGLPLAALGLVPLAGAAGGVLPWAAGLAVAAGCALLGVARSALALRDLSTMRQTADELLRGGTGAHPQSTLLGWRAAELTSDRNRKILERSLRGIERELDGRSLPSAIPLNRAGSRPHADLIHLLAERLDDRDHAVSPRGALLVQDLLTDGIRSPLYVTARSSELRAALERCLAALDSAEASDYPEDSASSAVMRSNGSRRGGSSDRHVASVVVREKR